MLGTESHRLARRGGVAGLLALLGVTLLAGPAAAHVEVSSDNAQALAEDVVLDFHAAAESDAAGITGMDVVLPDGIAPADVTLESGPTGWTLEPTADGYSVSGPALPPGQDAEYAVRVLQLPDAERLAFRTLQNYSDGHVDRWIALPEDGAEADNPAPVLELAPAPADLPRAPAERGRDPEGHEPHRHPGHDGHCGGPGGAHTPSLLTRSGRTATVHRQRVPPPGRAQLQPGSSDDP